MFKEKLGETRRQLRQAFLDKAKMARSIRQLQARIAADEAKLSHARKEEEEKVNSLKRHIVINGQETLEDYDHSGVDDTLRPFKGLGLHENVPNRKTSDNHRDKNDGAEILEQTQKEVNTESQEKAIMDIVWENYDSNKSGKIITTNASNNEESVKTEIPHLEHSSCQISAIGFADINGTESPSFANSSDKRFYAH